jgi:hypothetical protein
MLESLCSSRVLALVLASVLACGAQTPGSAPAFNLDIPTAIVDVVMHQRTIREPMAKVTDRNNKPVGGIAVTFLIVSDSGAGASFAGQPSLTVLTDAQGFARAAGMQHNGVAGNYQVRVSAGDQTKDIQYRNVKKKSSKYWLSAAAILLLVGTTTAVVVTRPPSANPQITLGPGTVTP